MRLAAAACALAIVVVLAIFGAVLAQKASTPAVAVAATAPAATTPAKPARRGGRHHRRVRGRHHRRGRSDGAGRRRGADDRHGRARSAGRCTGTGANCATHCRCSTPDRHDLRESERDRHLSHGRDRHHRRSWLRLRALQEARLPARGRDRADVRRRPVAAQYAAGTRRARQPLHQGGLLRDRQALDVGAGPAQAGRRGRTYDRHATPGRTRT